MTRMQRAVGVTAALGEHPCPFDVSDRALRFGSVMERDEPETAPSLSHYSAKL